MGSYSLIYSTVRHFLLYYLLLVISISYLLTLRIIAHNKSEEQDIVISLCDVGNTVMWYGNLRVVSRYCKTLLCQELVVFGFLYCVGQQPPFTSKKYFPINSFVLSESGSLCVKLIEY